MGLLKARRDDVFRGRVQREESKGLQRLSEVQNLKSSFHYGRKVFLMLEKVENLKSSGVFEVVVEERPLQPIILGQETMLERAWNHLMDGETGIMGLYWDLRVEKIQDEIAEKLGLHGEEWNRKEERQKVTYIHTHMKNKKFVLLLDELWRKVDLNQIGVPFPTRGNGCKVVFTTRSREVCGHMGVDDPMEVRCLAKNEAWDLFKKKVGKLMLKSHPTSLVKPCHARGLYKNGIMRFRF